MRVRPPRTVLGELPTSREVAGDRAAEKLSNAIRQIDDQLRRGHRESEQQFEQTIPPPVARKEVVNGRLVKTTLTAGTPVSVPHGFGRHAKGFHVSSQSAHGSIIRPAEQTNPGGAVTVQSDVDMEVELWVY